MFNSSIKLRYKSFIREVYNNLGSDSIRQMLKGVLTHTEDAEQKKIAARNANILNGVLKAYPLKHPLNETQKIFFNQFCSDLKENPEILAGIFTNDLNDLDHHAPNETTTTTITTHLQSSTKQSPLEGLAIEHKDKLESILHSLKDTNLSLEALVALKAQLKRSCDFFLFNKNQPHVQEMSIPETIIAIKRNIFSAGSYALATPASSEREARIDILNDLDCMLNPFIQLSDKLPPLLPLILQTYRQEKPLLPKLKYLISMIEVLTILGSKNDETIEGYCDELVYLYDKLVDKIEKCQSFEEIELYIQQGERILALSKTNSEVKNRFSDLAEVLNDQKIDLVTSYPEHSGAITYAREALKFQRFNDALQQMIAEPTPADNEIDEATALLNRIVFSNDLNQLNTDLHALKNNDNLKFKQWLTEFDVTTKLLQEYLQNELPEDSESSLLNYTDIVPLISIHQELEALKETTNFNSQEIKLRQSLIASLIDTMNRKLLVQSSASPASPNESSQEGAHVSKEEDSQRKKRERSPMFFASQDESTGKAAKTEKSDHTPQPK